MNPSRASLAPAFEPPPEVGTPPVPQIGEDGQEFVPGEQAVLAGRMLWEQRRFVSKVVVRGALLFLVIALLIPSSYESKTQLMPPDQHSSNALGILSAMTGGMGGGIGIGGGAAGGALGMLGDLMGMKTSGALLMSILKSETVQDRLIDRFDLRKVYWVTTYKSARKKLASRTDIEEDKKSGVISIVVDDRNRERAAALAKGYVEELNRLVVDLNTSSAHRERVFLEQRLKVVKQDLDASSKAFSEFASKNTAVDLKEQGKAMVEAAAVLQGQLMAAQSELSGLEQIYTPNNVRVRSLRARITELEKQLQKLGGATGSGLEETYPSIRQLPVLGVPYYDLYRNVKMNETVLEFLTKEYELARLEEAKEIPSIKVIDPAKPPEKRSGPPRTLITVAGALLSLCFAAVWLFGKEHWRNMHPQDPRKMLALDVATSLTGSAPWKRAAQISSRVRRNGFWRPFGRNHHDSRNGSNAPSGDEKSV